MKKIFFILLFLTSSIFSETILNYPNHTLIKTQNDKLVENSSLYKIVNSSTPPTLNQPIQSAFFKIVGATPSVCNKISANSPPSFYWIWGEYHQAHFHHQPHISNSACPSPTYDYYSISTPTFDGLISFILDNVTLSEKFNSNSKNPYNSENLSSLLKTINSNRHLIVEFNGSLYLPFKIIKTFYLASTICNKNSCRTICNKYTNKTARTFSYPIHDKETFRVEATEPFFLLTQPIDYEQLSISPQIKFITFSNNEAYKIVLMHNNFSSYAQFTNYSLFTDKYGFIWLNRTNQNKTGPAIYTSKTMHSNFTEKNITPFEFDEKNLTYSYQYFTHSFIPQKLGYFNTSVILTDDFNLNYSKFYPLQIRNPTRIVNNSLLFANGTIKPLSNINNSLLFSGDAKNRAAIKFISQPTVMLALVLSLSTLFAFVLFVSLIKH